MRRSARRSILWIFPVAGAAVIACDSDATAPTGDLAVGVFRVTVSGDFSGSWEGQALYAVGPTSQYLPEWASLGGYAHAVLMDAPSFNVQEMGGDLQGVWPDSDPPSGRFPIVPYDTPPAEALEFVLEFWLWEGHSMEVKFEAGEAQVQPSGQGGLRGAVEATGTGWFLPRPPPGMESTLSVDVVLEFNAPRWTLPD